MKKLIVYGFPFIIVMSIVYYKNFIMKDTKCNQSVFKNSYDLISNKWRIKRQLSITNISLHDNNVRYTNANESKNTSHSDGLSDKKRDLIKRFKKLWPVESWRNLGLFTDDFLVLVNEHWLQFPPPNEVIYKFLGSIYIIFATAGCWGNIIVLFMYFR